MSRLLFATVVALLVSLPVQAGVTIKLKNGRAIEVPVECSEVESISFSGGKPATTADFGKPGAALGMNILSAQYGIAGRYCDARPQVSAQCQGKEFCQMAVANHILCGDPYFGREKELAVDVQCKGRVERRTFPEGAQLQLRCQ